MKKNERIRNMLRTSLVPLTAREIHERLDAAGVRMTVSAVGAALCDKTHLGEFMRSGSRGNYAWTINPDYVPRKRDGRRGPGRRSPAWDLIIAVLRASPTPLRQRDIMAQLPMEPMGITHNYVATALMQATRRGELVRTEARPYHAWAINPDYVPPQPAPKSPRVRKPAPELEPKPTPAREAPDRRAVVAHLRDATSPQTPHEIAAATALPIDDVYAELRRLVRACRVQRVHSPAGLRYRAAGRRNDSPTPASPTAPAQHSSRGSSSAAAGAAPESFAHSQGASA